MEEYSITTHWKDTRNHPDFSPVIKGQPEWLTKPWEAPHSFNGELLENIKSPNWFPVMYKFYTEQNSEYIITKDGCTRRIKSYHQNTEWDDIWLKNWMDKAIFTRWEEWKYFNLASQILIDRWYKIQIFKANKNKHIAIICINENGKWRQAKISDVYPKSIKNKNLKNWPLKAEYSPAPELWSHILEFNKDSSWIITKTHAWSKVSHIEQPKNYNFKND